MNAPHWYIARKPCCGAVIGTLGAVFRKPETVLEEWRARGLVVEMTTRYPREWGRCMCKQEQARQLGLWEAA
jgi:hypothetical protein